MCQTVNLIKLKGSGKLKGRECANGETHRNFLAREEEKSPTITLDGFLTTH